MGDTRRWIVTDWKAGSVMTLVDFYLTSVLMKDAPLRAAASADRWENLFREAAVNGSDPRLTDTLTLDMRGPYQPTRAYEGWGPLASKWRIENAQGGWEGGVYLQPWADEAGHPSVLTFYLSAAGFGGHPIEFPGNHALHLHAIVRHSQGGLGLCVQHPDRQYPCHGAF